MGDRHGMDGFGVCAQDCPGSLMETQGCILEECPVWNAEAMLASRIPVVAS